MRSYLILKDKARQFREHAGIQALLAELNAAGQEPLGPYTTQRGAALAARAFDRARLAQRRLPYERLDQLVVDLLLGA
jgi:xylose isomerase